MGLSSVASSSTSSVATSPRDSASRLPPKRPPVSSPPPYSLSIRLVQPQRSGLDEVAGTPCSSANSKASIPRPPAMSTTPAPSPTSRSIPKVSTSQREDGVVFRLGGVARGAVRDFVVLDRGGGCGAAAVGALAAARLPSRRGGVSQDARRVRTSAKVRPREAHDVGVGATVRVPDARAPRRRLRGVRPGVPRATVLENLDALGKDRESTFGDVAAGGGLPETLHAHAKPGDDGLGLSHSHTRGCAVRPPRRTPGRRTVSASKASDVSSPSR